MDNLVYWQPKDILVLHGPTKLLVNKYHWHSPQAGIVASYTPTATDVHDHFGLFRGVDQIESFAQAATGSCSVYLECEKQGLGPRELAAKFLPRFVSIGNVIFHNYLEKGDTFVNIGQIKFYKFRQMVCDGRIYKAPRGLDLNEYFSSFTDERLFNYDLSNDFTLVADLHDVICRAIKSELFNKQFEQ
jgi:hypothetical protein